ncbi:1-(5-phosphoribosyl)-5-[(5-phosphoribosylamino)methylideneamino]imidazole-4-carboxamide isomerase [Hyphococcus flavus]|uniref:1-(5-phosphoribosyl)-5-[(5-phosphoribosylamino)methylideneamino] imidazole-4-carboxamide isomerase n=1 Tax=Hyphococcus flavus TaxID=1866326 RepID=A0AAE9ZD94_9PROT|nr:1-(5-phosphoribosyl)-5-[(5-phosphoribosylamino)methylideneamino]imidazole-4-carboxamide isomerase [Hyphococcus flavus]WDI32814.1 1-(5-phosphoribosyl)-5-[(5-phosphoribosylamino)methylideneamino]imidazole-4-carboxamide isomerase [Hyphococcus flavus]
MKASSKHTFKLYPAIDLKDGACVRLLHGRMDDATVYNQDPGSQAAAFEAAGFDWVHIVDLNGAFAGKAINAAAVGAILSTISIPAQLGGGIRDMSAVERWLGAGMARVILGTAAVHDPEFVSEACRNYPGQIVLGVDARDGKVRTEGWDGETDLTPAEIVKRYADDGLAAVIYTDISRDGALQGVNVEATAALAEAAGIPVIASGGVASAQDIKALKAAHANIEGVIMGRALYDRRIEPAEALAAAAG